MLTVLLNPASAGDGTLKDEIAELFRAAGCDALIIELRRGSRRSRANRQRSHLDRRCRRR
jgi:hypothetical protein